MLNSAFQHSPFIEELRPGPLLHIFFIFILFFKKILFIFREGEGGRKRGRETSMCG